jgi:hypothetical protein
LSFRLSCGCPFSEGSSFGASSLNYAIFTGLSARPPIPDLLSEPPAVEPGFSKSLFFLSAEGNGCTITYDFNGEVARFEGEKLLFAELSFAIDISPALPASLFSSFEVYKGLGLLANALASFLSRIL